MKFMSDRRKRQFFALIVTLAMIIITFPVNVYANEASDFEFDSTTKTITGYSGSSKDVVIPAEINGVAVEIIGDYAFDYNQLTTVTIPSGVTSIGNYAFLSNRLTTVIIPDSVTNIGSRAFSSNQLTTVTIPSGLTSIDDYAFSNNQLTTVTIPDTVTNIGSYAFSNNQLTTVSIPSGVTSIGDFAFNSNQLATVTILSGVTSIGNYAFCGNQLSAVIVPSGVTSIGEGAFCANKLVTVTIPDSVTNIGSYAFSNNQLTTVSIPNGLTSIGDFTFYYNQLITVTIPSGVKSIGSYAFSNNQLTTVTIPTGVTSIGDEAFFNNQLTTIIIERNDTDLPSLRGILSSSRYFEDAYATGGAGTYIGTQTGTWAKELSDVEKVVEAKAAIETAITNLAVSNSTIAEDILTVANAATLHEVGIAWNDTSEFNKTDATSETAGSITGILNLTLGSENTTVEINKTINQLLTINQIDNITISTLEVNFPEVTIRDNEGVVTGKNVIYTCEAITNDYGGTINHSDKIISLGEDTPNGTYTVTASLEDHSALPITFDIILSRPNMVLTPEFVELVKGHDSDFNVSFPAIAVYDGEGNLLNMETGIAGDDFRDYILGEPTEEGFILNREIPVGTYRLTYGADKDVKSGYAITKDFTITVRNPKAEYKAITGGSIAGDTIQVVEPGSSGTEVTANPDKGYEFLKWSDGITTASRTDLNISADFEVTAEFGVKKIAPIAGFGNALSLNGSNQYVHINEASNLVLGDTFTQEFWIVPNINDTATYRSIIGGQISSVHDRAPSIYLYNGTGIHAGFGAQKSDGSGVWSAYHLSDVLIADQWNHVALTYDGTFYRVYVNGSFVKAIDFNGKHPIETPLQYIGKLDNYFWGEFDELRIWNTALTQEELYDWMNKEIDSTHPKYNDLMAYWQFDESDKVIDKVSNLESTMVNLDENKPSQVPLRFSVEPGLSVEVAKMYYNPDQLSIETVIAFEPQYGSLTEFQDYWMYTPYDNTEANTIDYFDYFVHEVGCDISDLSQFNIVRVYLKIQETTYYTVDFKYLDNTLIQSQQIKKGELIQDFLPNLVGQIFVGWTRSNEDKVVFDLSTNITEDLILYPIWMPKEYIVTFENYDGAALKTETVEHGRGATAPADPTRENYTFSGWDIDYSNVTEDLTVKAQYNVNQHTVSFESNEGNVVDSTTVNHNSLITSPTTPIKPGYTFAGWYKDSDLTSAWDFASDKVMAEGIILYAKWTRVSSGGSSGGSASSGDSGGSSSNDDSDSSQNIEDNKEQEENTVIIINGQEEKAGKESVTEESGEKVVEVKVDSEVINKKIEEVVKNQSQETNSIEVPISTQDANKITTTLTGDIVKNMDDNDFNLSIVSKEVNYVIPAKEVGIESVAKNLGVPTDQLKEIEIEVKINKIDEAIASEIHEKAKANGQEIVFPPVSFEVVAKTKTVDGDEKQVTVSKFNQYVKRVMKLPEGVDPSKVTTGIVYNEDGTFSHVPTKVFVKDGIYYAEINSLTNSSYSAIWNPIIVESVNNHWSKEAVNDMASRLVIKNPETFLPDQAITRGEFAEYIVRALGIYRTGNTGTQKFSDVEMTDDIANAIHIAYEYGIISGYPDGTFKPSVQISREEAMVMYSRAMDIVRLEEIGNDKIISIIEVDMIASWAYNDVKRTLSTGIFNGKTKESINPKDTFTCAEAVTAIRSLLVVSELINK